MRVLMLAAGVGSRLYGDDTRQPPKALMRFGAQTLLERHIRFLRELDVDGLTLVVGYRKKDLVAEALRHAPEDYLEFIENPMYRGGPIISLWSARETLRSGEPIIFMDAELLYARPLLERIAMSRHANALAFDEHVDEGEDPVRICLRDGHPVEFGKQIIGQFDRVGEWPGVLRLSPETAALVADACDAYIDAGRLDVTYEHAIRDVMIGHAPGWFAIEDVSDVPWIEIDFPEDLERAEREIMPLIEGGDVVPFDQNTSG